jgi:hypothetical protein
MLSFFFNCTSSHSFVLLVFAERPRALTPKQHVALVCAENARDTVACCYEDYPENTKPGKGVSRMIGEWSASYDTLPVAKLDDVMTGIKENGLAPEFDRIISKERQAFLRRFVEAQMVTWESVDAGVSTAWFYWTMKMEGGAFAEWDFLRGVREGWIQTIPNASESSESLYGTCREIAEKTKDDESIINEFPDAQNPNIWIGADIDDDYVVSHAGSLNKDGTTIVTTDDDESQAGDVTWVESGEEFDDDDHGEDDGKRTDELPTDHDKPDADAKHKRKSWFPLFALCFFCYAIWRVFFKQEGNFGPQRYQYTSLDTPTSLSI